MKKFIAIPALMGVLTLYLLPIILEAQQGIRPGLRLGVYTDARDLFLGGEILVSVNRHLYFNPNVEFVFVENGTYVTFNMVKGS